MNKEYIQLLIYQENNHLLKIKNKLKNPKLVSHLDMKTLI